MNGITKRAMNGTTRGVCFGFAPTFLTVLIFMITFVALSIQPNEAQARRRLFSGRLFSGRLVNWRPLNGRLVGVNRSCLQASNSGACGLNASRSKSCSSGNYDRRGRAFGGVLMAPRFVARFIRRPFRRVGYRFRFGFRFR